MNKMTLPKWAKFAVIGVFVILSVVSILLMGMVRINYNISDYLNDSTDTKISLGIMEDEFGLISNVQVMVSDVKAEEAEAIKDRIKAIKNIVYVNFDAQNTDYFKKNSDSEEIGDALFVILVDGNEYSETAKATLSAIQSELEKDYAGRLEYGGTVMEKILLSQAIKGEIFIILVISLCLVAIIMLISAKSWIEPFVLLMASGIAVLLNMGTNAFFGEISYITQSIAAILQLALSVDYSIVLLHSYRSFSERRPEESDETNMLSAIKDVIKPVSASALTTIAGLLALLFMSFTIGFDIGSVLMKSIVISAITSITLLPALLLLFDKLMKKTAKKPLTINGRFLTDIGIKGGKIIAPIAIVVIVVGLIFSAQNGFGFVDSCNKNQAISDTFGESGTLIVLYENSEDRAEKEQILAELLKEYKTESGEDVLKNFVCYGTTVDQVFDVDKAVSDLHISRKDAELLFTVYRFTEEGSSIKLGINEFIDFAIALIENDEDALDYVSDETISAINLITTLDEMLDKDYTAEEFYDAIANLDVMGDVQLTGFAINQLYGLYFFDEISDKKVNFRDMIEFIGNSDVIDPEAASALISVINGYDTFIEVLKENKIVLENPKTPVNWSNLYDVVVRPYEGLLVEAGADPQVIKQYSGTLWAVLRDKNGKPLDYDGNYTYSDILSAIIRDATVKKNIDPLLNDMGLSGEFTLTYDDLILLVDNYTEIYNAKIQIDKVLVKKVGPTELVPTIKELVNSFVSLATKLMPELVTNVPEIPEIEQDAINQLYIMYFYSETPTRIPLKPINMREFVNFIIETVETNATIRGQLPEEIDIVAMLRDLLSLEGFLADDGVYDHKGMQEYITGFVSGIKSMDIPVSLTEAAMRGLYIKYAIANQLLETGELKAEELLLFLEDAAENDELIKSRISEDMLKKIRDSRQSLNSADGLLKSKSGKYFRILITVDLPAEGKETEKFVEYINSKVDELFIGESYVAGEIPTTYDLKTAFDADNKFITGFTVISIFIIILLVFKSVSLPVILVAAIQGAIWISMSFSLIGEPMFFMSYIMSMCILMGATIDYGILLSTNYVKARKHTDKKSSLLYAINTSLPTVFTSGLILMICGFVVGLVASQTSISSVGFLLCRGTLISVIMILLVLPSILYLLDGFVMKLTLGAKPAELKNVEEEKAEE